MAKFEENLAIKESFPEYLKEKIAGILDGFSFSFLPRAPLAFFKNGEKSMFYEFLENHALKHFASLQSIPKTLTMRSITSMVEGKEVFYVPSIPKLTKTPENRRKIKLGGNGAGYSIGGD